MFARVQRFVVVLALWLIAASLARAEAPVPERLLSENTLLYFRCGGLASHRQAYEKTALAEVMRGDLGQFFDSALKALQAVTPKAMDGLPAEERTAMLDIAARLRDQLKQHGFVIGLEVMQALPMPQAQLTIVFPGGKDG